MSNLEPGPKPGQDPQQEVKKLKLQADPCCGIIPLQTALILIGCLGIAVGIFIPLMLAIDGEALRVIFAPYQKDGKDNYMEAEGWNILLVLYVLPRLLASGILIVGAVRANACLIQTWLVLSVFELFVWSCCVFSLPANLKLVSFFVLLGVYFIVVGVFFLHQIHQARGPRQPFMPAMQLVTVVPSRPRVSNVQSRGSVPPDQYPANPGPPPPYTVPSRPMTSYDYPPQPDQQMPVSY